MHCVLIEEAVKTFARAIHCLAKIGHEIYIEPLKKGLSLRTVNSSRSAYACLIFLPSFFQTYDDGISDDSSQEGLKCKLSVKSCLSVFKSLSTIDRIVNRCSITLKEQEEQLKFLLYCQHGITKTYNLSYQDCESLQAIFTKDLSPNMINVQSRILGEVVVNFHNTAEEISFIVSPQNMIITNYIDEVEDPEKVIKTKMVLVAEEFEKFQIGVDTEVTFCLKELKGIITFADSTGQNMDVHFESAGKPIVFSLTGDPTYEANFVLATLVDLPPASQDTRHKERSQRQPEEQPQTSLSHSQHEQEDEFVLDEEEDWVNDVIAAEKGESVEKTLGGNKHPDFEDSFSSQRAVLTKAATSSKTREASTSHQSKDTITLSQSREASTSHQTRKANHSVKHIPSPPPNVPSYLVHAELSASMSVDSEISPGNLVKGISRNLYGN